MKNKIILPFLFLCFFGNKVAGQETNTSLLQHTVYQKYRSSTMANVIHKQLKVEESLKVRPQLTYLNRKISQGLIILFFLILTLFIILIIFTQKYLSIRRRNKLEFETDQFLIHQTKLIELIEPYLREKERQSLIDELNIVLGDSLLDFRLYLQNMENRLNKLDQESFDKITKIKKLLD